MSPEALLIIFVGISAFALVCQSLSMWKTSRSITQMVQRLEHQSKELEESAHQVLQRIQGVMEDMAPLGEIAENLKTNIDLISQMVTERAKDLDQFVQEMTEMGREQASKVNYVVNDTVQKFEQTTEMIQEDVLKPAVEISSFLKGLKAGLSYLFNKKASPQSTQSY
ncbi:hypothetical protein MYX82_05380, partial [Acidobacteria bacterium AH-259-D05]|nr:hypothetical protein [Acidobacteria bacterium AH-259-D05]